MPRSAMLVMLLALYGCDRSRAANDETAPAPASPRAFHSAVYIGKDSATRQALAVTWEKEDEIRFTLIVTTRRTGEQKTLKGRATANLGQDSEQDDDEEGIAYSSDEYWFREGDCHVSVRIKSGDKTRARVTASAGCPFHLPIDKAPILAWEKGH